MFIGKCLLTRYRLHQVMCRSAPKWQQLVLIIQLQDCLTDDGDGITAV